MPKDVVQLHGKDNYGKPKQEYADRLATLTDEKLEKEMEDRIWLSAYANNNPTSDYHWMCDATYAEGQRRDRTELYNRAWKKASEQ